MITDAVIRFIKVNKIDRQFRAGVFSINNMIRDLKKLAVIEFIIEIVGVSWIVYGEMIFYSENNTCNWENRHSSSYIMMFLLLTFGMILIFKWVLKVLETSCILIKKIRIYYQSLRLFG